ncbi:MAG: hypothetical protein WCP58_08025, partial [bacterium]
ELNLSPFSKRNHCGGRMGADPTIASTGTVDWQPILSIAKDKINLSPFLNEGMRGKLGFLEG